MKKRKLIKMASNEQGCQIWTVSHNGPSPGKFYILREEAEKVTTEEKQIIRDMFSFADIRIQEGPDGQKKVQMQIFWSKAVGEDTYQGKRETICIPYEKFQEAFQGKDTLVKCLDLQESKMPRIIFKSEKNLKEVVKHPKLKKKLGKFLSQHFLWPGSVKVVLYDDFVPYSFYFREYRVDRPTSPGLMGGVILHGQECMDTAHYSIHT